MDNFGTYAVHSKGKADAKTGIVNISGTDDDPMMKAMGFTKEFVHRMTFQSDDVLRIEVLFVDTRTKEKTERKELDFVFKRRK